MEQIEGTFRQSVGCNGHKNHHDTFPYYLKHPALLLPKVTLETDHSQRWRSRFQIRSENAQKHRIC